MTPRELAACDAAIERLVAEAPPFTEQQRDELRVLFARPRRAVAQRRAGAA